MNQWSGPASPSQGPSPVHGPRETLPESQIGLLRSRARRGLPGELLEEVVLDATPLEAGEDVVVIFEEEAVVEHAAPAGSLLAPLEFLEIFADGVR